MNQRWSEVSRSLTQLGVRSAIFMERERIMPDRAFEALRRVSQRVNVKVSTAAQEPVDTAACRRIRTTDLSRLRRRDALASTPALKTFHQPGVPLGNDVALCDGRYRWIRGPETDDVPRPPGCMYPSSQYGKYP